MKTYETITRILKEILSVCALGLLCVILWLVVGVVQRTDKLIAATEPELHAVLRSADSVLNVVRETVSQANGAIQETKELIAKQKGYSDIQNTKIIGILDQSEVALINFQRVMEDINDSQKATSAATVQAVNSMLPVLENTAKAAEEASKTISDPNIKKALEQLAAAMRNMEVITANAATTTGRIDKKVEQMMKPGNFIVNSIKQLLGIGANAATIVK